MSTKTPGVVRMGMIHRLPELTPEEFSAHWSGPHGVFATRIPHLLRYYQHHAVTKLTLGQLPDRWKLDGLSELWFGDIETMMEGIRSPDYSGLAQDTPTVMTMPGVIAGRQEFLISELSVGSGTRKAMAVLGRKHGVQPEAFAQAWRDRILSLKGTKGLAAASMITIEHLESEPAVLIEYEGLPVDLVLEFWFSSDEALDEAFSHEIDRRLDLSHDEITEYASAFKAKTFVIMD